ncbi:GNAT family N-acetyltransferase [Roseomonas elaeocarpi]|uniref:GNAT family N-acetyltransferase n=1 Tax=Roseomonas elaeocarpi TaxID=907779 RepID=A0ABV6JY89_9PROT
MLRALAAREAAALAPLHARAFAPPEAWGAVALRTMLEMPGAFGLAVLDAPPAEPVPPGASPAGFVLARVAAGEAELLTVAVDPAHRRRGFGAALLAGAAAAAVLRGAEALFLEVSEHNAAARALYEAAGFREVGRRRRYYADGTDALVLRLDLAPAGGKPTTGS